jgi:hypothetical protein
VGWLLCLKRRDVLVRLRRSALPLRLPDVVAPHLIGGDAWMVGKLESLRVLSGIAAQQIVGRERRGRVSQLARSGGGCFDARRRVNSTVLSTQMVAFSGDNFLRVKNVSSAFARENNSLKPHAAIRLSAKGQGKWRGALRFAPRPRALVRSSWPKLVAATRRSDVA